MTTPSTQSRLSKATALPVGIAPPNETPDDYIRRLLAYVEGKSPRAVLEQTPDRLDRIVHETPSAALYRQPSGNRWSAAQIIEHLADSEIVASYRIRMILAHDGVAIQAFDQNEWAQHLAYDAADAREAAELFAVTRRANLRLMQRVDPRRLENHGMHAERGRETVTHLMRLYAGHDLNHLAQIERAVG